MRIGVDAREIVGYATGVGRYLGGLLREWTRAEATHGHEIVLYAHQPIPAFSHANVRCLPGAGGTAWEQLTLGRAVANDKVDVLFSPAYSTPLTTRVPRVVALHDISFAARPEWFAWREGVRRRVLARRSAEASRAVVTISAFSKSEIMRVFGTAADKIHVVPPGIDVPACERTNESVSRATVLYVGSIFARRHVPDLLAAFERLATRHPDAALDLVGDNRSYPAEDIAALIQRSANASHIRWHRYAPDHELWRLYSEARAFAFLSEYEGLGLTPLEALAVGIPSVLLDTAVAREACGDAALYVPLGDIGATTSALDTLLYDNAARARLLAAAPGVLSRFDWRQAAAGTLTILESAA